MASRSSGEMEMVDVSEADLSHLAVDHGPDPEGKDESAIQVPELGNDLTRTPAHRRRQQTNSNFRKLMFQIRLLMWKRAAELSKNKEDLLKIFIPPILIFVLMILMYEVFSFLADGGIEQIFTPGAFWIYIQRMVVHIMYEKHGKLQESMRMMGLSDAAYWISYYITDGIILGFVLSLMCALLSVGGLFNDGGFGPVFGLFLCFCLCAVPFGFFITSFFDTPQSCGQTTFGILFGMVAIYTVVFISEERDVGLETAQILCCFVPPIALQIGASTFLKSYTGIPLSSVCGIMVADIFIYSILAWYFSQVLPSNLGVRKPFYFVFQYSYWFPRSDWRADDCASRRLQRISSENSTTKTGNIPVELVNEELTGPATVQVRSMTKHFGSHKAVDELNFDMYENQIFALLGHNGAGKTTCINMLTGLMAPDLIHDSRIDTTTIYGKRLDGEMDVIHSSLGICPQHDVLFEKLSVKEHILFFSQLKGATYEQALGEAEYYTKLFHLNQRLEHLGAELSGGQKRKLSVAIAVCGGSKFVVLDEPTAGMDPLARRELWDLMAQLRKGRTMLLTTHYMDEADILGDRVGIMNLGQMQCVGSTQFLKTTFGAGYKLIFDACNSSSSDNNDSSLQMGSGELTKLTEYVQARIPEAKLVPDDGAGTGQVIYNLPFDAVDKFGAFFTELEACDLRRTLGVQNFGVNITSLEDVFLKIGEDHTVTPKELNVESNINVGGIGADRNYQFNFVSQVLGISYRRLLYASRDPVTIPLVAFPVIGGIVSAILYDFDIVSTDEWVKDLVQAGAYVASFIGAPGLLAEFVVRERSNKLRDVLTVTGCSFPAYWVGTFFADLLLMFIPVLAIWIIWAGAGHDNFITGSSDRDANDGPDSMAFCFFVLFTIELVAFGYFFSFAFSTPKACITFMPIIVVCLLVTPNVVILLCVLIARTASEEIEDEVLGSILLWGIASTSPHGALFAGLLNSVNDYDFLLENLPGMGPIAAFMLGETVFFLAFTYCTDSITVMSVSEIENDPDFDPSVLEMLDTDVTDERNRVTALMNERSIHDHANDDLEGANESLSKIPVLINRMRKVFKPKQRGRRAVEAVQDVSFIVERKEIFGLLGANGAGKTTLLSMLTRHMLPTSGNGYIASHSVLSSFTQAATHLGVVTQTNSLWDRLSTEDHLYLFARLRGVPEDLVKSVVEATIDQMELTPHRHKLAMRLSGGMKRKLCVAIALIGDPDVVLLDEPSAGLDPVSRRNLWTVILRTMSHRAVILTTHSMEEAEALCRRIGIMVRGQLHALGSQQHLKNKFGSGFEMVVKLRVAVGAAAGEAKKAEEGKAEFTFNEQKERMTAFVQGLFPSTVLLSENGGLLTYRIPKEEMKMGVAFREMETNKKELNVEDYSVAQPTLEQVFIRTIVGTDEAEMQGESLMAAASAAYDVVAAPVEAGGGARFASGTTAGADEVEYEVNKCGCTTITTKIFTSIAAVIFIVTWGVAIAIAPSQAARILTIFGFVALVVSIVGCNLLCCACCKAPKGSDE